jgi:hypothetical protein
MPLKNLLHTKGRPHTASLAECFDAGISDVIVAYDGAGWR